MLLDQAKLLSSGVVANNLMNRARVCAGGNGYQKDLKFELMEFLAKRLADGKEVGWLDLCCGEGRALIEVAEMFAAQNQFLNLRIIGVDLVGMFQTVTPLPESLTFVASAVEDFDPGAMRFDLITCVHGLHYLGDKLACLQKAAAWLKPDGVFLANLDVKNLKISGETKPARKFASFLRKNGFCYDAGKHLLTLHGAKNFEVPFEYLGADDAAGANYTGQAVVDSYYRSS